MSEPITVETTIHVQTRARGCRRFEPGVAKPAPPPGRVPRVARLLALAHRFEALLRDGVVQDYAELARLGRVSRARLTQVMNLLLLAPDLQEQVLFLPPTLRGRDPIRLALLQPIALTSDWARQRARWEELLRTATASDNGLLWGKRSGDAWRELVRLA